MFEHVQLRPRSHAEAGDLGLMLCRHHWSDMLSLCAAMLLPIVALAWLAAQLDPALALVVIWWLKPTLDRPMLHLLSRRTAGMQTSVRQTLAEVGQWWRGGHLASLLLYRWHPERSVVLPVWQLEGLRGRARRQRSRMLGHGGGSAGIGLSTMTSLFEMTVMLGLGMLAFWLLPSALLPGEVDWLALESGLLPAEWWGWLAGLYALSILIIEPFYLSAGFGLYLNQRCRLECWDLEPPLRQLAARSGGPA